MPRKSRDPENKSARQRILELFLTRGVGVVINKDEIMAVARIAEWARRVRELRDEYGWDISSHNDRDDLSPGEYILESETQGGQNPRYVSEETRQRILSRDGFQCVVCKQKRGEIHHITGKRVRVVVDHLVPVTESGGNDDENLRTLCTVCNHHRKNYGFDTKVNVLALVRQQPKELQLQIYQFLKQKFERQDPETDTILDPSDFDGQPV